MVHFVCKNKKTFRKSCQRACHDVWTTFLKHLLTIEEIKLCFVVRMPNAATNKLFMIWNLFFASVSRGWRIRLLKIWSVDVTMCEPLFSKTPARFAETRLVSRLACQMPPPISVAPSAKHSILKIWRSIVAQFTSFFKSGFWLSTIEQCESGWSLIESLFSSSNGSKQRITLPSSHSGRHCNTRNRLARL